MQSCSRGVHDFGIDSFGDNVLLWRARDCRHVLSVAFLEVPGCCGIGIFTGVACGEELGCATAVPLEEAENVVEAMWCGMSGR